MRITVFGVGYVGLVTATGLSELGHDVCTVDIDPEKIRALTAGTVPIYEPGLENLVRRNSRAGRLHFAQDVAAPWDEAEVYFLAVGTPQAVDGSADISAVLACAKRLAQCAAKPAVVAVKSTVPVGTCDRVQEILADAKVSLEVASNPEFLKEGSALEDFFRPDRVVIGARSDHAKETLRRLYTALQLSGERVVLTDPRSSELIKYAANTMLAMRVSFMNELSRLCHATGANIHSVRMGIGTDGRIGRRFLYAGPGYGGSCFPKDVQALVALGRREGVPMRLAEATHLANQEQGAFVERLVVEACQGRPQDKVVALWGLAFKPETDDVREAPSLQLARALLSRGAKVVGHDPEASANFSRALPGVTIATSDYDAVDGADVLVLLTEWRSYRAPNFDEIRRRMRTQEGGAAPWLVDARNVWRAVEVERAGLRYRGIGVAPTVESRA